MRNSPRRILACLLSPYLFSLSCTALLCLGAWLGAGQATAQQLDLSLNLQYSNTSDPNSGGDWTLVGRAPGTSGIVSLGVRISGIATQQAAGPSGQVNGGTAAGFSFYGPGSDTLDIETFQIPIPTGGGLEQPFFYGVGSLANGAPNFAGAPAGSASIGPAFSTLTGYNYNAPWGADDSDFLGDPTWDIAVPLATGTFDSGVTPQILGVTQARVFTSVPLDIFLAGSTANLTLGPGNLFVRDDLIGGPVNPGDYNLNGIVDAADYTVWLDSLGATVAPVFGGADGDGSGVVDAGDYEVWKTNFGTLDPAVGVGQAVPEPTTGGLAIITMILAAFPWRNGPWRNSFSTAKKGAPKAGVYGYLGKNVTTA